MRSANGSDRSQLRSRLRLLRPSPGSVPPPGARGAAAPRRTGPLQERRLRVPLPARPAGRVRIEDDLLITAAGAEVLTAGLPVGAEDLAELMGGAGARRPDGSLMHGLRRAGVAHDLMARLQAPGPLVAVELRPPRLGLDAERSIDLWIDMHHAVQRLARDDTLVLLTDDAAGSAEEESLAHLSANLGRSAELRNVLPFLTCNHPLDYCRLFVRRAAELRRTSRPG